MLLSGDFVVRQSIPLIVDQNGEAACNECANPTKDQVA